MSWSNPQYLDRSSIAVSKTNDFKSIIYRKNFDVESEDTVEINEPGTYYWKVLAYFPGREKPIASQLGAFVIKDKLDLKAPELLRPQNQSSIPLAKAKQSGLFLQWSDVPGSESYQIKISTKGSAGQRAESTDLSQFRFDNIRAGTFSWQVRAIGPAQQASKWSEPYTFKIADIADLAWVKPASDDYRYKTLKPTVSLAWEDGPNPGMKWRLRFGHNRSELVDKDWIAVKGTKTTVELPSDGKFVFEVQALDKEELILAATKIREITVLPPPPLDPPMLMDFDEKIRKANADGSIRVRWKQVADAKSYIVKIKEPGSKTEKIIEESKTGLDLKGLSPGRYQIRVSTVDERGIAGDPSEAKFIEVPKFSDIKAPKVNAIKVQVH